LLGSCETNQEARPSNYESIVNDADVAVEVTRVRLNPGPLDFEIVPVMQLGAGESERTPALRVCRAFHEPPEDADGLDEGDVDLQALVARTADGTEIDRWDGDDCPDGDVPDEWRITDQRSEDGPS
jgi:hypothetical protein